MTHHSTRKHFFAKLLGLVAAAGVSPKLLAKSASSAATSGTATPSNGAVSAFEIRHDTRAVARRDVQ